MGDGPEIFRPLARAILFPAIHESIVWVTRSNILPVCPFTPDSLSLSRESARSGSLKNKRYLLHFDKLIMIIIFSSQQ